MDDNDNSPVTSSSIIKKLKQRVEEAENAYDDAGLFIGMDEGLPLLRKLYKAQDDLAKVQFKFDVKNEWKRIQTIVDEELERIAALDHTYNNNNNNKSNKERCVKCNEDLCNRLALVRKYGINMAERCISKCCGKLLCSPCLLQGVGLNDDGDIFIDGERN